MAIVLAETLERKARGSWVERLHVDATDIDRQCLARAAAAVYRQDAFTDTPADLVDRYTTADPGGRRVVERVRTRVRVGSLDLSRFRAPGDERYDLICCRNVVIYFERAMQEQVFQLFVESLAPGGYLVLGKVETLLGPARERLEVVDTRERIYRSVA